MRVLEDWNFCLAVVVVFEVSLSFVKLRGIEVADCIRFVLLRCIYKLYIAIPFVHNLFI